MRSFLGAGYVLHKRLGGVNYLYVDEKTLQDFIAHEAKLA